MFGSIYVETLSEFVFFFSDDLTLQEEKDKKCRDHVVEGTCRSDNVIVMNVSIVGQRKPASLNINVDISSLTLLL